MSEVEDVYKKQRYEEEMAIAKRISERVTNGQFTTDPRLLEMLHQNAGAHGIVVPRGHDGRPTNTSNQVHQDLEHLGFDFGQFEMPEIEVIKREIELLRHSIATLVKSTDVMLSREKLEAVLKNYITNQQARIAIIDLFLEKYFTKNNLLSRVDVEELAQGRWDDPEETEIDEEKAARKREEIKTKLKNIIRSMGDTFDQVLENRAYRKITSQYETQQPMGKLNIRKKEPPKAKEVEPIKDWEYGENRVYYMNQYLKASFCFCLAQLATMPQTILWLQDPKVFNLEIPSDIYAKLSSLSGIAEEYKLFDYTKYFEQTLATYMRIFLGYYKNEKQGKLAAVSS